MQSHIPNPVPTNAVIARKTYFELFGFRYIFISSFKSSNLRVRREVDEDESIATTILYLYHSKNYKIAYRQSCHASKSNEEDGAEKSEKVKCKPRRNIH